MSLTDAQLAERSHGLGGSEALAYCGKDPRCSPLQLYLRKIGEAGEKPPEDGRMQWGNRLEPVVRDWLQDELNRQIDVPRQAFVHPTMPFLRGNLDGILVPGIEGAPREVVEIKTGDKFTSQEFGELGSDEIPIRYVLQVTHYMIVTGFERAHLGVLLGGNDARHYVVDYDADLATALIANATRFWRHVEGRDPPEVITLHDADKRWPKSTEKSVAASPEIGLAIDMLKRMRAEEKQLSAQCDATELTLKTFMGDADTITDAQGKKLASWKSQSREALDTKALMEAHPDLVEQFKKVSNFRVFRIK